MGQRLLVILFAALIAVPAIVLLSQRLPPKPPDAGIPIGLAEDRAKRISELIYEVTLTIPKQRQQPIEGRMRISFNLRDAGRPLAFDFTQAPDKLRSVTANGRALALTIENGHIVIPADALVEGGNKIEIYFIAGDESLNRNDEFLYALFVPARASLALPVFDQPDLKARWQLNLYLPSDWEAVSNAA